METIKTKLLDNYQFYKGENNTPERLKEIADLLEPGDEHITTGDHGETSEQIGLDKLPNLPPATGLEEGFTTSELAKGFILDRYAEHPVIKKGINITVEGAEVSAEGALLTGDDKYFHRFYVLRSYREFKVSVVGDTITYSLRSFGNSVVTKLPPGVVEWSFRDVASDGSKGPWSDVTTVTSIETLIKPPILTTDSSLAEFSHVAIVEVTPFETLQGEDVLTDIIWTVESGNEVLMTMSGDPAKLSHTFKWGDFINGAKHRLTVQYVTEKFGPSVAASIEFTTTFAFVETPSVTVK